MLIEFLGKEPRHEMSIFVLGYSERNKASHISQAVDHPFLLSRKIVPKKPFFVPPSLS
jgi:hypothetical protein